MTHLMALKNTPTPHIYFPAISNNHKLTRELVRRNPCWGHFHSDLTSCTV